MKKFKKIYIEITNICNLTCSFCSKSKRKPQSLSRENFKYILKEIHPFTDYIYLHVKGEPLLHPELPDLLDIAYEEKFKVHISTNGVLINKVKDMLLHKPAIRQMNFSLHSITENKKENYLKDILEFTEEALDSTPMIIALRLWNFNKEDKSETHKNLAILKTLEDRFCEKKLIEENLILGTGLKLKERLYLNTDYRFQWPDIKNDYHNENGFCHALRSQIAILTDGTVVPCCLDGEGVINLGNIFKQNFEEIITNDKSKAIYDGFTNHKAIDPLCIKCSFKERFE